MGLKGLEKVKKIGNFFLYSNKQLNKFYAPYLECFGNYFLYENIGLSDITIGYLKEIGNNYFKHNLKLSFIITSIILKEHIDVLSNSLVRKLNNKKR